MREKYDRHFGKFNSRMAHYVYERILLEGNYGDEDWADGGEWANRYGCRVLDGDKLGNVSLTKWSSTDDAHEFMREFIESASGLETDSDYAQDRCQHCHFPIFTNYGDELRNQADKILNTDFEEKCESSPTGIHQYEYSPYEEEE